MRRVKEILEERIPRLGTSTIKELRGFGLIEVKGERLLHDGLLSFGIVWIPFASFSFLFYDVIVELYEV